MNWELSDVQAGFRKGRGTTSASLTILKPLTVWITTNWKSLEETGITDLLTCLLRNLYAGQEATVRTGHGTTDRFKIGKVVYQACLYCHPAYLDTDFYLSYIWLPSFSNTVCWEDNFSPINYIDSFVKSKRGLFLYFLFYSTNGQVYISHHTLSRLPSVYDEAWKHIEWSL